MIIFDLDNCLFNTQSMGRDFLDPVINQLAHCVPPDNLENAMADLWRMALTDVLEKYQVPKDRKIIIEETYQNLNVPEEAKLYPDVLPTLQRLHLKGTPLHLVTKGYRTFQNAKLQHLALYSWFYSVHIVGDPTEPPASKYDAFVSISEKSDVPCEQCWVIGDGPEEITAGNELGMPTIQTLRPGVTRNSTALHCIDSLDQLFAIVS